jgi:hypothetical protein
VVVAQFKVSLRDTRNDKVHSNLIYTTLDLPLASSGFLLLEPEDEGDMFLRNVAVSLIYTVI